jgi:hypothetical protein
MRMRKRHAWGAVLIVLFALPLARTQGVPLVEEPTGAFLGWVAGALPVAALRPAPAEADGDVAAAYERQIRLLWDEHLQVREQLAQVGELGEAFSQGGLDRLPRAVLARVLRAHDPVPLRRSILIDRGADDGVEPGHPVVMGSVFLGRVRLVHARSALVQLVTDPHARLEVFVRTRAGRLLRGYARRAGSVDGEDRLAVSFLRLPRGDDVVDAKAPVLTANADERVPAHLLVGLVDEVSDPDLDRIPTLTLVPALDLDRATEVLVLLTGGAPAPRSAEPVHAGPGRAEPRGAER